MSCVCVRVVACATESPWQPVQLALKIVAPSVLGTGVVGGGADPLTYVATAVTCVDVRLLPVLWPGIHEMSCVCVRVVACAVDSP